MSSTDVTYRTTEKMKPIIDQHVNFLSKLTKVSANLKIDGG